MNTSSVQRRSPVSASRLPAVRRGGHKKAQNVQQTLSDSAEQKVRVRKNIWLKLMKNRALDSRIRREYVYLAAMWNAFQPSLLARSGEAPAANSSATAGRARAVSDSSGIVHASINGVLWRGKDCL